MAESYWKSSDIYQKTRGKSWFTRFTGYLNNFLNPNHDWIDYAAAPDSLFSGKTGFMNSLSGALETLTSPGTLDSLIRSWTGSGLTGQQIQANEMSMQNQEDIFQRQVTGMRKAGVNPALMYQSGAASAPSSQGSPGTMGANMSDLMSAMLMKKQARLLDSQANKTDAETDKLGQETEQLKLVNKYYPKVTDTQIMKMLGELGLTEKQIEEAQSRIDLNKLDKDLKEIQKIIEQAKADESSRYYRALRELTEAQTDEAKAKAREEVARAVMEELEGKFMDQYNAKMGSSEWIALASALCSVLDIDLSAFGKSPYEGLFEMLRNWMSKRSEGFGGRTSPNSSQQGPSGNSR